VGYKHMNSVGVQSSLSKAGGAALLQHS